ncbi:MAG: hypothetical protein ACREB2_14950 [Pseudolabrys sp.]
MHRGEEAIGRAKQKFTYFIGLPVVAAIGSFIYSHVDYLTAYQNKVKEVGEQQMKAAEGTYADISKTFSDAITLQQLLFFNYRDAVGSGTDGKDGALETKNARAIYPKYDELRTNLRENIDLLARRVEIDLDWASDPAHDAANAGPLGADQISRLKLGAYDFDCDKNMPSFAPGTSKLPLQVPPELKKENPNAMPLGIDWYSAKHELLTLYFCFDKDHGRIEAARRWAAMSQADDATKKKFMDQVGDIKESFDREAVRLDTFLTLGARDIEAIRVKFRARRWFCHLIVIRQIVDVFSNRCTPLRTAQATSDS